MQLYIKNNYASKLNMGNPSSKLVHSSVFPELHNTRSTKEILEWLENHKFVLSAPSGHTILQSTVTKSKQSTIHYTLVDGWRQAQHAVGRSGARRRHRRHRGGESGGGWCGVQGGGG
jgi:hypothetical protein